MEFMDSYGFRQWAFQFTAVLFLVGGLAVIAVGVSLIVWSTGTLRFFVAMNRWVSTRRAFKPIEIPRDTSGLVQKYRRALAVALVAGGAFALYGLFAWFNARAVGFVFGLDMRPASVASWLVDSARWVLIVGNLAAMVIGIMLCFFSDAMGALEARGARWYSDRRLVKGGDTMNFSLDNWVAASPRFAGWIMTAAGVVLVSDIAMVLLGIH